ncbi:hypothetical protein [Fictibacillus fluitans]|uniref:Uncharacterized protein n=1 Tax=Fictibacillus fluitans TaxID=3058422 RepID=A0ABT8HZ60_9BACL|nr:hypothetical protein [Fictibacillus sp. NE201]MDN4525994.1 hypothetical protein [Fictibacillus sp. NE201]
MSDFRGFPTLPCGDLFRAGRGSGIAVKESSFQTIAAAAIPTFPLIISLDDAATTRGVEFVRNGIVSGLQSVEGGTYDFAYIVSTTITTATTTAPYTLNFELITSTGRIITDSSSSQIIPVTTVLGTSINTNLEVALHFTLLPGETVSIVLRSITGTVTGSITINTASLYMQPTGTAEQAREESSSSSSSSSKKKCESSSSKTSSSSSSSTPCKIPDKKHHNKPWKKGKSKRSLF